jgi:type I restriction enzyme S subunit
MSFKEYTIEECCDILNNLRFPLNAEQRFDMQGEFPYYGANGVQGYINQWRFDDDLILIAEDGGNFEQFDKRPIAYRVSGKCWVNNHAHVLKAKEKFSQSFIFYSLEHKNILFFIAGGTRSKLTQGELKKITIPHPEKKFADKIGNILEKADAAITQTEALIAKYQRIKTGLMQDLLTKGIDEHGNIRSEQTHRFKMEKGLRVPEDWEVKELDKIAIVIDSLHQTPTFTDDGIPMIRVNNVADGFINLKTSARVSEETYNAFTRNLKPTFGDIVISRVGSYGLTLFIETEEKICIGQNTAIVRPEISYDYLNFYLKSNSIKTQIEDTISGSSQKSLSLKAIRNLKIGYPKDNAERLKIAERIQKLNLFLKLEQNKLSKLQSLKTGLMQDLLSGKVRVKIKEETLVNP